MSRQAALYWPLGKGREFSSRRSADAVVAIQAIATADVIYWRLGNIHDSLIAALA